MSATKIDAPNPPGPAGTLARAKLLGSLAALATVLIWGSWLVFTRLSVTTFFTAADTIFLRFAVSTAILAPFVYWRSGIDWRGLGLKRFLMLQLTAGALFLFIVANGVRYAPMADIGAMLPGAMPIFVTLFGVLFYKERFGPYKYAALVLIISGVILFAWDGLIHASDGRWVGHLLLLTGAASWAIFTYTLKDSGLTAVQAAFVVNASSVPLTPLFFFWDGSGLLAAPITEILVQALVQGVFSGVVAMITYAAAVRLIGSGAALFAALVPGIATLVGIPVLGDTPTLIELIAIAVICFGLAWAAKAK